MQASGCSATSATLGCTPPAWACAAPRPAPLCAAPARRHARRPRSPSRAAPRWSSAPRPSCTSGERGGLVSAAVSLLCLALVCLLCCPCSQRSPCDSTAGTRRFCGTSAPERSPCSCTKGRRSPRPVRRRSCLLPPLPLPALPACLPPPCCISLQALLLNIARRPCCLPLLPPRPVVARRRPRACRGLRRPAGGRRRRPHHVRRLAPGPLPLRRRRRPRTQPAAAQEVRGECWEEGLGGSGRGGCRGGGRCTRDEKEAAWRRDLRNAKQRCHPHSLPPPRLQVMPTPLNRLRWWRVCLDEAQMVESSTAKAAEMALKLDTVHRW